MSNVGGGKDAGSYYEKADDYYTKDKSPSLWQGKGAKILGLSGPVGIEEFRNLLDGNLPDGSQIKVVAAGHRGGTDLTFSAPKSLSIQAFIGGDERLIEAHNRAVERALAYAETLVAYRYTEQGETKRVSSKIMTAATYRHELSRACDPQLHTHCVVLNFTQRRDKQWRAIDNEPLYRQKMLIGALYRAELAREVQKLGYETRRTRDDGLFELANFTERQLEEFSSRSKIIEEVLAGKGKTREEATAEEKKIITIATRPKKTDVDRRVLQEYWEEKASRSGIDLKIPHKISDKTNDSNHGSHAQAIRYAVDHAIERQAVVTEDKIVRAALEFGVGQSTFDEIKRALKRAVAAGHLIQKEDRFTTPQAQEWEREILSAEKRGRGNTTSIRTAEDVFLKLQGLGLNQGQRDAAAMILATQNRIIGVQGLAGTGKTFMLQSARNLAEESGYQVLGLAPSAAAARELEKTGIKSRTLASFENSETKDLHDKTLLVVDEASMVPSRQMQKVLKAVENSGARVVLVGDTQQLKAVEAGKPFAQLQAHAMEMAGMGEIQRQINPRLRAAVELAAQGNVSQSLSLMEKDIVEIQHHQERYERIAKDFTSLPAEDRKQTLIVSGTNAARKAINEEVRKNLGLTEKNLRIEILENKDLTRAEVKQIEKYSVGDYVKPHRSYRSLNMEAKELCKVVEVNASHVILEKPDGDRVNWEPVKQSKFSVYRPEIRELAAGDRVRISENDSHRGLNNGDYAMVRKIEKDRIHFAREDGKDFSLEPSKPLHLDHGYCSTVHSAQGRTCERVLMDANVQSLTSSKDTYYVALSRARREVKIYTNDRERLPEMMARENVKEAALEIHRTLGG
jgi:conjugative relaxase-like TrwC/TraI family protein